jgi:ribosomal protein L7/L12
VRRGIRIEAITHCREAAGGSAKEPKDFVDRLQPQLGVL